MTIVHFAAEKAARKRRERQERVVAAVVADVLAAVGPVALDDDGERRALVELVSEALVGRPDFDGEVVAEGAA